MKKLILIFGLILLCFSNCKDTFEIEKVEHVLVCYLAGENNLSSEVKSRVQILEEISIQENARIVTLYHTRDQHPVLAELANDSSLVIKEYPKQNTSDPQFLSQILYEIKNLYPHAAFGLLVFSHATGWLPKETYSNPALRAPSFDDIAKTNSRKNTNNQAQKTIIHDSQSEMDLIDFTDALPDYFFQYIIFETCHMAGVEVAYELKSKASYIIASSAELVEPGFTPLYDKIPELLFQAKPNLIEFCKHIRDDYANRKNDYSSLTLSLIDLNTLDNIAAIIKENQLSPELHDEVQIFDRKGGLFYDLLDSYSYINDSLYQELRYAIDQAVIFKTSSNQFLFNYGGFEIQTHSGLTTYIPQEEYLELNEAYKKLAWWKFVSEVQ